MTPLRTMFYGGLGALLLLVLVSGGVGAVVAYQAYAAPDRLRATILRQIDEYEAWVEGNTSRQFGRNTCTTGSFPASCDRYQGERERFMVQHPELRAYEAWFLDARRAEFCPSGRCGYMAGYRSQSYTVDDWRDDKYLTPYIRSRR